jgi:hypothetical protein
MRIIQERATLHAKNRQDIRFADVLEDLLTAKLGLALSEFETSAVGAGISAAGELLLYAGGGGA